VPLVRAAAIVLVLFAPALASAQLRAIRLPQGDVTARVASSDDELAMVRIGVWRAGRNIADDERPALAAAMDAAYARMHERVGPQPSVFAASHFDRQGARGFDALIGEPDGAPRFAVVFLHGYGGNFTWPCFAIAEAVRAEGGVTLCPSVGTRAHWAEGEGPAIVAASIASLEARGIERILLAGISSGGVGASRLAPRLEDRIDGLILISGALPLRTELPVWAVHGRSDRMLAFGAARRLAERNRSATLLALEGGHFVFAEHTENVQTHLRAWLRAR
jgi:pimeloyl-ACP methyl ester carboxylesterase